MPQVSIVIPVYNVEPYITQCLDSLINQTLKDIEIIIINDCSPANEDKIIRSYANKDRRIKYIKLKKNVGLGEARNIGFSHATGDYFGCVDSDDYVDATMFEKMFQKAQKLDADICMVEVNAINCALDNQQNRMCFSKRMRQLQNCCFSYKEIGYDFFDIQFSAWSRIYKKEFYQKYIHYPKNVKYEDVIPFMTGILNTKKCCIVSEPLYIYRQNRSGSITSNVNINDICLFIKQLKPLFKKLPNYGDYQLRLISFYAQVYTWFPSNKELYEKIRPFITCEKLSKAQEKQFKKLYPFAFNMKIYDFDTYMRRKKIIFTFMKICPIKYLRKKMKKNYK